MGPILLKKPSAWIPITLSLGMLAFILIYIAMYGVSAPAANADEGTPAYLFQLWLVLEVLLVAFFTAKWLPRVAREALKVFTLQITAALVPVAIVFYFNF